MLLKEEEVSESNKEHIDKKRSELTEQQIQLCISVLKTTDCYDQLEALERATPKQLLVMRSFITLLLKNCCNGVNGCHIRCS